MSWRKRFLLWFGPAPSAALRSVIGWRCSARITLPSTPCTGCAPPLRCAVWETRWIVVVRRPLMDKRSATQSWTRRSLCSESGAVVRRISRISLPWTSVSPSPTGIRSLTRTHFLGTEARRSRSLGGRFADIARSSKRSSRRRTYSRWAIPRASLRRPGTRPHRPDANDLRLRSDFPTSARWSPGSSLCGFTGGLSQECLCRVGSGDESATSQRVGRLLGVGISRLNRSHVGLARLKELRGSRSGRLTAPRLPMVNAGAPEGAAKCAIHSRNEASISVAHTLGRGNHRGSRKVQ